MIIKKVVVRAKDAGAFFGTLVERDRLCCVAVLDDCRRLWSWAGAASLSQLAMHGVAKPDECKFTVRTQRHEIAGVIEVIPATPEAIASIEAVPEWKV